MINDPRFDKCGFILSSIRSEFEFIFRDLRDKYKYLIWLEEEAKYELENYNDSVMEERVENVLEWIEKVKPPLIKQIKDEKPILLKTLKIENTPSSNQDNEVYIKRFLTEIEELNSIPSSQWTGICNWNYNETVKFVKDTFNSVHKQISIYNQIISISKQGDEDYKKAGVPTDEMIKKKELRRLLKLKIKELKLLLEYPEPISVNHEYKPELPEKISHIKWLKNLSELRVFIKEIYASFRINIDKKDIDNLISIHFINKSNKLFPVKANSHETIANKMIKWGGTEEQILLLQIKLEDPKESFIEKDKLSEYSFITEHFINKKGKPFNANQLSKVRGRMNRDENPNQPNGFEIIEGIIEKLR